MSCTSGGGKAPSIKHRATSLGVAEGINGISDKITEAEIADRVEDF